MCDTEARYNAQDPAQIITDRHSHRNLLQCKDYSCAKGSKHEVKEEREDLSINVG